MSKLKKEDYRWSQEVWHTSLQKILTARLKADGLLAEYKAKLKAKMDEGLHSNTAAREVRKEYMRSEEEERAWYHEFLKARDKAEANKKAAIKQKNNIAAKKAANFAEALDMIENQTKATFEDDMQWVYCHPAMGRSAVSFDPTKPILITADDILNPGHGEAPSRGAAMLLQHNVNNPKEFFDRFEKFAKGRKQTDTSGVPGGSEYNDDIGIAECRRLHRIALELEGSDEQPSS